MYNEDGIHLTIEGIARDITAQKMADRQLKVSENKYRSLFENMFNGFALHKYT